MPIPPLVAEMDNPPTTKAGIIAFIPKFTVSGMENLMIQNNIIHQSYKSGVKKLLFLGSSDPLKELFDFLRNGVGRLTDKFLK